MYCGMARAIVDRMQAANLKLDKQFDRLCAVFEISDEQMDEAERQMDEAERIAEQKAEEPKIKQPRREPLEGTKEWVENCMTAEGLPPIAIGEPKLEEVADGVETGPASEDSAEQEGTAGSEVVVPTLKQLLGSGDYQAYMRARRNHGDRASSPARNPGLMTRVAALQTQIEEAKQRSIERMLQQSGLAQVQVQASEHHRVEMEALQSIEGMVENMDSSLVPAVEGAVEAAVNSALGKREIHAGATVAEQIDFFVARRKSDALLLHRLRQQQREEKEDHTCTSRST